MVFFHRHEFSSTRPRTGRKTARTHPARVVAPHGRAMVKFEGFVLLGFWGLLLLLDKDGRAAFWPPRRFVLAGLFGFAGWLPYLFSGCIIGAHTPNQPGWGELTKNWDGFGHFADDLLAFLSRRFLTTILPVDFAGQSARRVAWQVAGAGIVRGSGDARPGLGVPVAAYPVPGCTAASCAGLCCDCFGISLVLRLFFASSGVQPMRTR